MQPHSQAYRPLRVEGSTYLLFPEFTSTGWPLDAKNSAAAHLPAFVSLLPVPNLLPPGHQHPVPAPEPEQAPPRELW